jgi:O-antigen/teichoic acid export membrane protein
LGKVIPFALLGIYGVARSLSEMVTLFAGRLSSLLIFPIVANNSNDRDRLETRLKLYYNPLILLTSVGLGVFAALSDNLVRLLYDARYWLAGDLLPIFILGVWFATLASIGDGILLGLRKPALCLIANVSKAAWLLTMLPLGFYRFGLIGAVVASAAADLPRYASIAVFLHRARIRLFSIELLASIILVCSLIVTRLAVHAMGLSGGLESLFIAFRSLR